MSLAPSMEERIEIPQDVEVNIEGKLVTVKGPNGTVSKTLRHHKVFIELDSGEVKVISSNPTKREKSIIGTFSAHVKNMIKGVTKGFEYRMKIVYSHFPMRVSVKDNKVVIENFLGERYPRFAKIRGDTQVAVKADTIILTGINIEEVSQTASNIEKTAEIKGFDPRVFQDGIYIVSKGKSD